MASADLVCVIMAGGAGTRFWPASTAGKPKQFLAFFGERTLLQMAFDRARLVAPPSRILVLTAESFIPLCREQLPALPAENIVGEPLRRDTAAAVALAVALVEERFGEAVMAVLTADHKIAPDEAFARALVSAAEGALASGALYTFGVRPTFPATGYGYVEVEEDAVETHGGLPHYDVRRFVEKPDLQTAEAYVASGRYLWNSGMFVWPVSTMARHLERLLPEHLARLRPAVKSADPAELSRRLGEAFEPLRKVSIDVGVMEPAGLAPGAVRCLPAPFSWSDVGSFVALADHLPHDDQGNTYRGALVTEDSAENVVFCEDPSEQVALLGVTGLVVVRAGKRTLVVPRARAEEVKRLVESLPEGER